MRHHLAIILGLFIVLAHGPVRAGEEEQQAIRAAMQDILPDLDITRIRESDIPGLYEVLAGTRVYYVTGDGRYLLRGDLFDLGDRRNLTKGQREAARSDVLGSIPSTNYIEFAPEHPDHVIYVFTDVTCGFCRKLHQDVPELNSKGLAVRYLAFPRQGVGSSAYKQMVSVWCADDRKAALTAAKQGRNIEPATCPNPVADQFDLGRRIGVHGTPAIYLEDGRAITGYRPPDTLVSIANGEDEQQ